MTRSVETKTGTRNPAVLRHILPFLKPYWGSISLLVVFSVMGTLCGLVPPYLGKVLIDDVFGGLAPQSWLAPLVAAMAASCLLGAVLESWAGRIGARMGSFAIHDLRCDAFRKIIDLPMSYHARNGSGDLVARINSDTQQLEGLLVDFIPYLIKSLLMFTCVTVILIHLSLLLSVFVMGFVMVAAIAVLSVSPRFQSSWGKYFHFRGRLVAFATEVMQGIRIVKVSAAQSMELERFSSRSEAYREAHYRAEAGSAQMIPLMQGIAFLGNPIVWWVGGGLVLEDKISVGEVVAFSTYLLMLFGPVFSLGRFSHMLPNALAAADRVFILEADQRTTESPDGTTWSGTFERLEFRSVTFSYDPGRAILHDLSFEIQAGQTLGIVGHSGAGKSTLFSLICRLFDPDKGCILVDERDLRSLQRAEWRGQLGVLLQEALLMPGTVAENIAYGYPSATSTEIAAAARLACAHDFIQKLPHRYDSEVQPGGANFSIGERQRISLARAIFRDPAILLLDEPTSAVDAVSERSIRECLRVARKGRTTLIIAHRLSTLHDVDRILVLDEGRLVEDGTHDELANRGGVYSKLLEAQDDLAWNQPVGG